MAISWSQARRPKPPRTLPDRRAPQETIDTVADDEVIAQYDRPQTRGDCKNGPRPCPFVSCRHHLFLDVNQSGSICLSFPELEVDQLVDTCSLDVADRGGETLESTGNLINRTRERTRQIEFVAIRKLRAKKDPGR